MLQGTTPELVITIPDPIAVADIINVEYTMEHVGTKKIVYIDGVTLDPEENTIMYRFTERETLDMDPKQPLYWQLRIKTQDGIFGTKKETVDVEDLLSEEAMP
jgi:hypothetical protein